MSDINYVNKPIMDENVQITKQKLSQKQPKILETPITVLNKQQTSVEGTLSAINNKECVLTKEEYKNLSQEEKMNGTTYYISDINGDYSYADCPIGAMLPFGGSDAPDDWLLCQGQAISRTEYADLFAVIGTSFGSGDGSTTFNVPNLKGKVAVGLDSNDTDFDTMGESGGEKTHQLTVDEMPSHNHPPQSGNLYWIYSPSFHSGPVDTGQGQSGTYTSKSVGGNQAHNNLQPYTVTNYIIKAKITTLPLDFEEEIDNMLDDKADKATTLAGYNITNAYTKDEVDDKISEVVTSLSWKEAVATYDDIATTYPNPQEGWTVCCTDTNIVWRYSGGQWVQISANTIPVVTSEVNGLMTSAMLSTLNTVDNKQNKTLDTSLNIGGTTQTTVEGSLDALNTYKATKNAANTFTASNTFNSNLITKGNLEVQADSSNRRIRLIDKLNAIGTTIASVVWGLVGIEFVDKNNKRSTFIQPTFNTDGSSDLVLSIDSASNPKGKIKISNDTFDYANSKVTMADTLTLTNYRSLEILTGADAPLVFYENANEDYKAIADVKIGSSADYRNYQTRYRLYCQGGHLKFVSWDANGNQIVNGTII